MPKFNGTEALQGLFAQRRINSSKNTKKGATSAVWKKNVKKKLCLWLMGKQKKSRNPNLLFRVENRLDAAMVRVETAAILLKKERYSAAIYIAGVAVECLLRAFIERDDGSFSYKHDMAKMIKKVGDPFLKEKLGIDEKFDVILNYWDNKYRYTDDKKMKSNLGNNHIFFCFQLMLRKLFRTLVNLSISFFAKFRLIKYFYDSHLWLYHKFSIFLHHNSKFLDIMANLNRLKVVLVEQGKTGKWLAEQLGKSNCTVSKWCSNSIQPDLKTLNEIANYLDVDVKELLCSSKNNI